MLFAALCAYVGAALYPRLMPSEALPAIAERERVSVPLDGIAVRREQALYLPRESELFARDGDRLSADVLLAAMAGDGDCESPGSCVFLAFCDGLEYLSVEDVHPLCAEGVRALMASVPDDAPGSSRIVRGFDWYYAAVSNYAGKLPTRKYSLRFDGFDENVSARLLELSQFHNGERALLFRLTTGDAEYLKLRITGAELILPEAGT